VFKTHADFAKIDTRHPSHPGTPVRTGKGFDVWQDKEGRLFLIRADGERVHFIAADDAEAHAAEALKAHAAATAAAAKK
jgi:hypothetical protein